jgi:hypothetical protein
LRFGQAFANERQHRRIGELKQHARRGEENETVSRLARQDDRS